MIRQTVCGLVLAVLALAGVANAQESPIGTITASPMDDDSTEGPAWVLSFEEVERLYPAVARAVRQPHHLVEVADHEQESTRAFFDEQARRGVYAIDVDGALYSVGISIASGLPPAAEGGDAGPEAASDARTEKTVPGLATYGALAAAGLAALVAVAARARR